MINLEPISFAAIKGNPDQIERIDVSETEIIYYLGFINPKSVGDKNYAIIKISEKKVDNVISTRIMYPNGLFLHDFNWELRETYHYEFKKF